MLPSFLIIGAMKSATTTLFRDLGLNPAIFVPEDKEPNALASDHVLTDEGRTAYAALFRRAAEGQLCGEASTSYTKHPEYGDVPGRALRVLGNEVKLIYLVRDPVDRVISHHHHDYAYGRASRDIDAHVRTEPRYLNVSRYMWQLDAWLQRFDRDQIHVLRFEDFVIDRRASVDSVSRFLGVAPAGHLVDVTKNFNPSDNRRAALGRWQSVARSGLYRRVVRPWLPWQIRERVRHVLLPRGAERPPAPSEATVRWLVDELSDDVRALSTFLGRSEPLWERWAS